MNETNWYAGLFLLFDGILIGTAFMMDYLLFSTIMFLTAIIVLRTKIFFLTSSSEQADDH